MMANWEASLAARDGVFAQIFLLTLLLLAFYRAWAAPDPARRALAQLTGLVLFIGLFVFSVANVVIWTP